MHVLSLDGDAETALAKTAVEIRVAEGVSPMAHALAEAIEADRASAAAAETRHTAVFARHPNAGRMGEPGRITRPKNRG